MDVIIVIITIVLVIYGEKKKKKRKSEQKAGTIQAAQNTMQKNMTQAQQKLKRRLQQKYEAPQSKASNKGNNKTKNPANSRAVQQTAPKELRTAAEKAQSASVASPQPERTEENDLMKEVYDLIIMGYASNLSFERDFVAEGVEMLNSYELTE